MTSGRTTVLILSVLVGEPLCGCSVHSGLKLVRELNRKLMRWDVKKFVADKQKSAQSVLPHAGNK